MKYRTTCHIVRWAIPTRNITSNLSTYFWVCIAFIASRAQGFPRDKNVYKA